LISASVTIYREIKVRMRGLHFLVGLAIYEGLNQVKEITERRAAYQQARAYADAVGKPLLVVGAPKLRFYHPCGDVTIDISPERALLCDGQVADVRSIPYPDGYFGAALASHVLEHLPSVEDVIMALDELHRVADRVFVVSPHKSSLLAWMIPHHHLWISQDDSGLIIEQRAEMALRGR